MCPAPLDPLPAPPAPAPAGAGVAARALARLDAAVNRLYGSALNPLYRSGTLTAALLVVLLVTGLYLLLFYRVGAPWASVARITEQVWLGRWIRGLHRFASAAALIAATVHAIRMFAQGRSWGRRTMPWVSGVGLVGLLLVSGWSGYVMVWDTFGQQLAIEGARLLDLVPLFSEPLGRAFVGERPIPGAFFFLNLFVHIAVPIGMGAVLLLHVSRLARPVLFPARRLLWAGLALLAVVAVLIPVGMAPEADPLRLPEQVPLDVFYAAWLPLARRLPAWGTALGASGLLLALLLVPRLTRPVPHRRPAPSSVNERLCTGCEQCVLDCPYEAVALVARSDGREGRVAHVDPLRCVSCGICAGSCAPMGVGPPERTGRDQLTRVREFIARRRLGSGDVAVVACSRGAGGAAAAELLDGAPVFPIDCAGSLHSSVVEALLRGGAGGVLVLACPVEDCWNREGAVWLGERLFRGREAELQARVDRRRILLANLTLAETASAGRLLTELRARIAALEPVPSEAGEVRPEECESVPRSEPAPRVA